MSGQESKINPLTAVNRRLSRLFAPRKPPIDPPAKHNDSDPTRRIQQGQESSQVYDKSKQATYILKKQELADVRDGASASFDNNPPEIGAMGQNNEINNALAIYAEHFNLKMRPFSLLPDPDFMFWSTEHRRAYTMLEYGIVTCAPITLITGDIGSGKTTLLRHLLNNMEVGIKVGLVSNAHGSRGELLRWVLMSLDQTAPKEATYVDLFEQFQTYLIQEYAQGNRVVIIFDEAQNLSRESLEELRMFTNINANKDELIQLVLVGQPELRDMIRRSDLRQFAQRVAANFHLGPMDAASVQTYIGHRLQKAGAKKNLFTKNACTMIFQQTQGVPRLINQLCDLAMVYAFTNNQKTVTERTVQQVLDDGAFFCAGAFETEDDEVQ
ncbi:Archaeal ATPase [Roseovarius albus]|uniref:Archaeal ATPase n=1 Tax=Roseovarius albus TaxID=1247867 RepID=A0A1X6YVG9_9RHOB|nr:AAA family ATPase [Roseovarius albus]SLN32309.1 Archaeal ATPase [Roseovarius albus]